jgi:ubiquinone/menaquinone biosynthesis C-methylase UbiE
MMDNKSLVKDFWNEASCGEALYFKGEDQRLKFNHQRAVRYALEPFIVPFAGFDQHEGKRVLEIGVGMGADHQCFAEHQAELYGCDLTERAIALTQERLHLFGLRSELRVADAEQLPYADAFFDLVYSWGVIHHSPDTPQAVQEIYRVLKPGGTGRIMIYHKHSMVGYMLWLRYGLLAFKPWKTLNDIYAQYLESPGTKAYTVKEAYRLFSVFKTVEVETLLGHGDLLSSSAGQRHEGRLLSIARKIYPRRFIKLVLPKHGLFMLVKLTK